MNATGAGRVRRTTLRGRSLVVVAIVLVLAGIGAALVRTATESPAPVPAGTAAGTIVRGSDAEPPAVAERPTSRAVPRSAAEPPPLPDDACVILRPVDAAGAPILGGRAAAVRTDPLRRDSLPILGRRPEAPTLESRAADAAATADAAGRLVLTALPPGAWQAVVDAPGCAREVVSFVRGQDPLPLDMTVPMVLGCALRGRVVDSRGAPISGVIVATDGRDERGDAPDAATRRDARSGADGAWQLTGLRPGRVSVWTWRDANGWRHHALVAVPDVPSLDLVLPDGGTVTGVVRAAASGLPVTGASVEAWSNSWERFAKFIGAATTDADGRYRLPLGDWRGSFEVLRVRADGFADLSVEAGGNGSASADEGEVVERDVALEADARLGGRVTGPAGPVADAEVVIWCPGTGPFDEWVARSVRTGSDGTWLARGLAPGPAAVDVAAPGLRRFHAADELSRAQADDDRRGRGVPADALVLDSLAGRETRCDVELVPRDAPASLVRIAITGTVRTPDGAPVAGAKVDVWSLDPAWTSRDGTFHIEAEVEPDFAATIDAHDGTRGAARGTTRGPYVDVAKTETWRDVVLVVQPFPVVRGRVRSRAGLPVAGARVVLGCRGQDKGGNEYASWEDEHPAVVAADGSFELPIAGDMNGTYGPGSGPFEPRGPSVVAVRAPGHATGFSSVFEIADPPSDVSADVELDAGHPMRGHVIDAADGTPVAGATVSVAAGTSGGRRDGWPPNSVAAERAWVAAVTDADGTFSVPNCGPGEWRVVVHAPGREADEVKVTLPLAEPVTIRIRRTARIAGRVLGPSGRPVAGADVQLVDPSRSGREARGPSRRTNADGTFDFPSVPSATWRLDVAPPRDATDIAAASVEEVVPGTTSLAVSLPTAVPIAGRVTAADGSPIADVEIECVRDDGSGGPEWANSAADGTFRIGHLRAGRHRLRFHGLVVEVAGVEAGRTDVLAKAAGGCRVAGRLLDAAGEPADDRSLTLVPAGAATGRAEDDDGFRVRRALSGADGTFVFLHVPEGEYDLRVFVGRSDDGVARTVDARVRAGTSGVELRLPAR